MPPCTAREPLKAGSDDARYHPGKDGVVIGYSGDGWHIYRSHVSILRATNPVVKTMYVENAGRAWIAVGHWLNNHTNPDRPSWYLAMLEKLESLTGLQDGWNSYGSAPPNDTAINIAKRILEQLRLMGLRPERIVASAQDGVSIYFLSGNKSADVEIYNSGEAVASYSDGVSEEKVWEVQASDLPRAITQINDFIAHG